MTDWNWTLVSLDYDWVDDIVTIIRNQTLGPSHSLHLVHHNWICNLRMLEHLIQLCAVE